MGEDPLKIIHGPFDLTAENHVAGGRDTVRFQPLVPWPRLVGVQEVRSPLRAGHARARRQADRCGQLLRRLPGRARFARHEVSAAVALILIKFKYLAGKYRVTH